MTARRHLALVLALSIAPTCLGRWEVPFVAATPVIEEAPRGAPEAGGDPGAWLQRPDAVVVLLVVDGLRADYDALTDPDGNPLMPRLTALARDAVRLVDCESSSTHPGLGWFELLTGGDPRTYLQRREQGPEGQAVSNTPSGLGRLVSSGFSPHVVLRRATLREDRVLARLPWFASATLDSSPRSDLGLDLVESIAREGGRHLLVVESDHLVAPFRVDRERLHALDPRPWDDGNVVRTMGQQRQRRWRAVSPFTERDNPLLGTRRAQAGEALAWAVRAAHAQADSNLTELIVQARQRLGDRAGIVLTSTVAAALGERDRYGWGEGVTREQLHVPVLLWHDDLAPRAVRHPLRLGDLPTTLAAWLEREGTDALAGPGHSVRWSLTPGDATMHRGATLVPGAWGEARMSTPHLSFRLRSTGERALYDRGALGAERVDVAPWEPALADSLTDVVRAHFAEEAHTLCVLVRSDGETPIDLTLAFEGEPGPLHATGLETFDTARIEDHELRLQLIADPGGDVVRVPFVTGLRGVRRPESVEPLVQRWGLSLGLHAELWPPGEATVSSLHELYFRALVRPPAPDAMQWLAARPPGIYVWIEQGADSSH